MSVTTSVNEQGIKSKINYSLLDVICSWEVRRVAPIVDRIFGLIYTYIIHSHGDWIGYMLDIHGAETFRLT